MKELITRKLNDNTINNLFIVAAVVFICLVSFGLSFFVYDIVAHKRPLQINDRCEKLRGFVLTGG